MTTFGSLLDWKFGSFLVFLLQNQWLYSYAFLGTLLFADCVKIASNDNKFFLRATYFTNNPGGHHTMWTFFGSHFNFFSFNYSKMSKLNLNQNKTQRQMCKRLAGPFIPFPGLVWSEKEFHFGCDHEGAVNNHFPVYWAIFRMVTNKQTNKQPDDPSASLLLTSEKAVFCKKS